MLRVAILADDLTGALDSAEPFARSGAAVTVATSVEAVRTLPFGSCDVIAVNTDSRALAPEAAARAIGQAWRHIAPWRPDCVFKKIDSRLKGNVGAEVAALIGVSGRSGALVAPAISAIGRITRAGQVTGFGVDEPLSVADLAGWRSEWTIPDCLDGEMMARIAKQALAERGTTVAVGASGLAEAMAAELAPTGVAGRPPSPPSGLPMLMVIGSRDPITLRQISVLAQAGVPPTDLVLMLPPDDEQDAAAADLARRSAEFVNRTQISAILLSGGDTAAAFVRAAQIDHLTPLGALAQGMPVSRASMGGGPLTIITKSGGFGTPDTLVQAFRHWRGAEL